MSAEYGWTTEEILKITMKEVSWRLEAIAERRSGDNEFNAAIHGVKLKGGGQKAVKLSNEQQEKIDKAIKARMKNGRH